LLEPLGLDPDPPTVDQIRAARERLRPHVAETPLRAWIDDTTFGRQVLARVPPDIRLFLKEELFQHTGTFKVRGTFLSMLDLDAPAKGRGVTTVSGGNHALAVSYVSRVLGTSAKVVMPKTANPGRIRGCTALGAEVVLTENVHEAFKRAQEIEQQEARTFVHPFEGPAMALGAATIGLEIVEALPDVEAVVIPIGGGGLCAGIATAMKQLRPECRVYGVEPSGADTMHRSFAAGRPEGIESVRTIADSLGAPHAAPYSYSLCRRFVDALVRVEDDDIRRALYVLFRTAKLAVEPAGAAATAAVLNLLRDELRGRRVVSVVCGANITATAFARNLEDGARLFGES
jgi:threonine dehydratase